MMLRLKYRAYDWLSTTIFGELGFCSASKPISWVKGLPSVAIWVWASSKQRHTVSSCEGWMNGSSPCTLITTS